MIIKQSIERVLRGQCSAPSFTADTLHLRFLLFLIRQAEDSTSQACDEKVFLNCHHAWLSGHSCWPPLLKVLRRRDYKNVHNSYVLNFIDTSTSIYVCMYSTTLCLQTLGESKYYVYATRWKVKVVVCYYLRLKNLWEGNGRNVLERFPRLQSKY